MMEKTICCDGQKLSVVICYLYGSCDKFGLLLSCFCLYNGWCYITVVIIFLLFSHDIRTVFNYFHIFFFYFNITFTIYFYKHYIIYVKVMETKFSYMYSMISYSNSLRYTIHRFVHPNKNWNWLLPLIPATHYICIQTAALAL